MPEAYYQTLGFQMCGPRAVRIDMLERLADMIRPLLAFRAHEAKPGQKMPSGSTGDGGFLVTPQMMSIMGCSSTELSAVLESLGFRSERKLQRLAVKQPPPAPVVEASVSAIADAMGSPPVVADDGGLDATSDAAPELAAEPVPVVEAAAVFEVTVPEVVPVEVVPVGELVRHIRSRGG